MTKKIVIISVLILMAIGGTSWYIKTKGNRSNSPNEQSNPSKEEKKEYDYDWETWKDPSGFSFEYPKETKIDEHTEDEVNYAHLTLTNDNHSGKITIICNDTEFDNIDSWLEGQEEEKEFSSLETEIASVSGRKINLGENKEMTAFIDWDKVIYTVETETEDEDYWLPVYKHILSSFELIPLKGETEAQFKDWFEGFNTTGVDVIESVEVIQ